MLRAWVMNGPGYTRWPRRALWRLEAETEHGKCWGQVVISAKPDYPVGMRYETETIANLRAEAKVDDRRRWRFISEEEALVLLLGGE